MYTRAKIAVIEDDPDLLESYLAFLTPIGDTVGFTDPKEFLRAINQVNPKFVPDLVISDLRLPGTDGVRMIADAHLSGVNFPAVLISGNLDKDAAVSAAEIGVFRMLEKPFSKDALLLVVNQLLTDREITRIRTESLSAITRLRELHSMIKTVFDSSEAAAALEMPCLTSSTSDEMQSLNQTFEAIEAQLDSLTRAGTFLEKERSRANHELYSESIRKHPGTRRQG